MNQKGFANIFIIIVIVGALLIGGGFYVYKNSSKVNPPSGKNNLPDLIIDSVSYKAVPSHDSFGMPVIDPGKSLEFTVKVKNIGNTPLADAFYISNSRSSFDFTSGYYSHTQVVNYNKQKINPGATIDVKILDFIDENVYKVRFLIATDGKTGQKDVPLPTIPEKNYQNNTLELQIGN